MYAYPVRKTKTLVFFNFLYLICFLKLVACERLPNCDIVHLHLSSIHNMFY